MFKQNILFAASFLSVAALSEEVKLESLDFLKDNKNLEQQTVTSEKNEDSISLEDFNVNLNGIEKELKTLEGMNIENKAEIDKIKDLSDIITKIDESYTNSKITKIDEIEGFYEVYKNGKTLYIHESGDYIVPIVARVTNGGFEDIREAKKKQMIAEEIKNFPKSGLVTYESQNPRAEIYVFSDYTCPYCRRVHNNLLTINNLGVTVHYIPFPRNGVADKNTISGLKNIVCSDIPSLEFTKAFERRKTYHQEISPLDFNCEKGKEVIHNSLLLADKLEVKGTPYIFLSNGAYLGGWKGVNTFGALLEKELIKEK